MADINRDLIVDIGMSEGNDSAFYLAKGFSVVGVEADPTLQPRLAARFAGEIADGRLRLLHRAAFSRSGQMLRFFHDDATQGQSSLDRRGRAGVTEYEVASIAWPEVRAIAGVPYYLKLDIEGGEPPFLASMFGAGPMPPFISAEVPSFNPVEQFRALGYTHFRLINQAILHEVALPDPPREGRWVPRPPADHWSGPFGRELPGSRWFSFAEIKAIYETMSRLYAFETLVTGWLDCHATRAEALE